MSANADADPGQGDKEKAKAKAITTKDKLLSEISEYLQKAEAAQLASAQARHRADSTEDEEEKAIALEEAAKQEKIAKGALKTAQRLQSGVWQGGAAGAGIGAGVGAGLGTVVGSLVGGVTSIPTTGLGLLVGAGTGAVHGPWFKIGKEGKNGEGEREPYSEPEGGGGEIRMEDES